MCWLALAVGLVFWTRGELSPTTISGQQSGQGGLTIALLYTLTWFEVSAVGALIAWHQARSPIGWLTLAASTLAALQSLSSGYASYAAMDHGLPAERVSAWFASWIGAPSLGFIVLILLVFPNGQFLFGWTRGVAWLGILSSLAQSLGFALQPGPLRALSTISNPVSAGPAELADLTHRLGTLGLALSMLAAAMLLWIRLRRATGKERQQLKWIVYAAALFTLGVAALGFAPVEWSAAAAGLFAVTGAGLTTAVGVAMLRYQLFDIDVLINRTLIYGSLIVTLTAAYATTIVLLQVLLSPFTRGSEIAIALSTLGVAALFGPALRRIRVAIDRRFYRSKYDAARTLEAFTMRLREEVDLDSLTTELLTIVQDTMQPTHMSLWLRQSAIEPRSVGSSPERQ
jgi:hypothetical protein